MDEFGRGGIGPPLLDQSAAIHPTSSPMRSYTPGALQVGSICHHPTATSRDVQVPLCKEVTITTQNFEDWHKMETSEPITNDSVDTKVSGVFPLVRAVRMSHRRPQLDEF